MIASNQKLLMGAAGVTSKPIDLTYISNAAVDFGATLTTSYTFTSQAIGATDTNRWVIVVAHHAQASSLGITTVSFAGNSVAYFFRATDNNCGVGIAAYKLTTGTTADIALSWEGSGVRCAGIGVYRVINTSSNVADVLASATSAVESSTASITPSDGGVISWRSTENISTDPTITGSATQNYKVDMRSSEFMWGYSTASVGGPQGIAGNGSDSIQAIVNVKG